MRKGLWSESEIGILVEKYPYVATSELSAELDRDEQSVKSKAWFMGIKKSEDYEPKNNQHHKDEYRRINSMDPKDVPLNKAFKNKMWLEIKYLEEEYSAADIAEITDTTRKNIEYWMNKHGIERRNNKTRFTNRLRDKIAYTSTGRIPFSKGLTKNDHPGIMRISIALSGEKSYLWKGGRHINGAGYVCLYDKEHRLADKDGYVLEHRTVAEGMLGRALCEGEVVHHRDFDRQNNSPDNLFVFPSNSAHTSFHNHKRFEDSEITEERFMEEVYNV